MRNKIYIDMRTFEMFNDLKDERISGPMFECDELLAPTIQALNKLGFKTQACCSGHVCDFKGINHLTPGWRDKECYIIFATSLEDCEKHGFIIPQGFELLDPSDMYEDPTEYDWAFGISKEFDERENKFMQILDTAKMLYGWAMAMVYAREREHQAAMKIMKETYVEIIPPYDWRNKTGHPVINDKFATIVKWKDCHDEDDQALFQDYYDFISDLRDLFFDAVGKDIDEIYPRLKKPYEYSRMKYFLPPIKQRTLNVDLVEVIAISLEEMYGQLYDQYNDPCGPSVIAPEYYMYLDELMRTVKDYVEKNY